MSTLSSIKTLFCFKMDLLLIKYSVIGTCYSMVNVILRDNSEFIYVHGSAIYSYDGEY